MNTASRFVLGRRYVRKAQALGLAVRWSPPAMAGGWCVWSTARVSAGRWSCCGGNGPGSKALKQWRDAFLAYFTTSGANNGGTEAINGLIELHRRIARGFRNRDNYRLRMLLIAGGLDQPPRQG